MTGKRTNHQSSPVGSPTSGNISDSSSSKEQDRFLPIANVSRIMKRALPANAKISKEAKETVQECVSEFISFVTGEASDKCQREKRKTINGDDLLWAMTTLGFENYVGPLKLYLNNYRETEGDKTTTTTTATTVGSAAQEDHPPTDTTTNHHHQHHHHAVPELNKFANSGFYSVMTSSQVAPKSFTEMAGLTGFRDNSINMAIAQNVAHNDADGNLRYRLEW